MFEWVGGGVGGGGRQNGFEQLEVAYIKYYIVYSAVFVSGVQETRCHISSQIDC